MGTNISTSQCVLKNIPYQLSPRPHEYMAGWKLITCWFPKPMNQAIRRRNHLSVHGKKMQNLLLSLVSC